MVINDNYKLIPDADYLFAADIRWWYKNYYSVPEETICYTLYDHPSHLEKRLEDSSKRLRGVKWTADPFELNETFDPIFHGGNSGLMGIQLTMQMGYDKIILVGFDHQHTAGKRHWFGDHDPIVGKQNAEDVDRWVDAFSQVMYHVKRISGIDVVNCSLETSIESCRRSTLEIEIL